MRTVQIHVGQSLEGVQQYLDVHADVLQSVNQSDARQQLDSAVVQLKATLAEQNVHVRELRGVGGTRVQQEAVLVKKFMTPLAKWARANLQGDPALGVAREGQCAVGEGEDDPAVGHPEAVHHLVAHRHPAAAARRLQLHHLEAEPAAELISRQHALDDSFGEALGIRHG